MTHAGALLERYPIVSDQITRARLEVVLCEFEGVLTRHIEGNVVEFGCYIGTTSLFIRRLLDVCRSKKTFHVYDSFTGLPEKLQQDMTPAGDDFRAGELSVSKSQLIREFKKANLVLPVIHKGWFKDIPGDAVPEKIAFAFLDGDFYSSILDSLRLVYPRMAQGGIIAIDDAGREALPGVDRAISDYFQNKDQTLRLSHNIGILVK